MHQLGFWLRAVLIAGAMLGAGATVTFARPPDFLTEPAAGPPADIAWNYIRTHRATLGLTDSDLTDVVFVDTYVSRHNGTTHLHLRQRLGGIEVFKGDININISRDGRVINLGNHFVPNLAARVNARAPALPAAVAIQRAARSLGLQLKQAPAVVNRVGGPAQETHFANAGICRESIPARLMYFADDDGPPRLVWNLVLRLNDGAHWWAMNVDAVTGKVLSKSNWIVNDTYKVYPLPLNNPDEGARSLVTNPADIAASPFGWHDTNGVAGAEYTDTRGNNVFAQEDADNNDTGGFRPDGGASSAFDFPIDFSQSPAAYQSAVIANLFYWNNVLHDVHYQYGFDEPAGNFQVNNYGHGGLGGDPLQADAQDGSGFNNANFGTPPDGSEPRMQMFIWTFTSPNRDSSVDNGIIIHEFGHGVSTRLTGGPSNVSCLDGIQSGGMGEGWSDWWTLVFTAKPGETNTTPRGVGTYVLGEPTTGAGIRRYPYTTDMTVNPLTYGDVSSHWEVHDVGEVWCAALWDMYWNLVNRYGFDPDLYHGAGGNNLAMQLVIDGLKLQPCNPTFLNARDAILLADQNNSGGANQDIIWAAFAGRGMGFSATDGGNHNSTAVTEAFDVPDDLRIVPDIKLIATGPEGGPFDPPSQSYTLTNTADTAFSWTATKTAAWLDLSGTTGSLPGKGAATVTATFNTTANALPLGVYHDTVTFTNQTSGVVQTRAITLRVGDLDDFTEIFTAGDNDLDNSSITFIPDGSANFYAACRQPATEFPTDPTGGVGLSLNDDDFVRINLTGDAHVTLFGKIYTSLYIGSNGYITFGAGDTDYTESLSDHFNLPRVAALFDDLNPGDMGNISWKQLADRVAVTYQNIPEYGAANNNSFQIELFFDGRIRITWLGLATGDGLVGLSRGSGIPDGFVESDLSGYGSCPPPDVLVITPDGGLSAAGPEAGPFTPTCQVYTLTNTSPAALDWTATSSAAWLAVVPIAGTLGSGNATNVTACISATATNLPTGNYTGAVTFQNLTSTATQIRTANLKVGRIDYFTELFSSEDNDLHNQTLTFVPDGSAHFYSVCRSAATAFPADPAGNAPLILLDDYSLELPVLDGKQIQFYGIGYSSYHVGSNGYITFGEGDNDYTESLSDHFSLPRIVALFDDLDPSKAGSVSANQLADRVVVTYQNVPEYGKFNSNNFQVEMFFDGTIRITWLTVDATDGLAGLSAGNGLPLDFEESNLSAYGACIPVADLGVNQSDDPDPVVQGATLTYTVVVTNAGPASVANVTLTDTLPAGITVTAVTPTQGNCVTNTGFIVCNLGSLAKDNTATVLVTAVPGVAGIITNQASIAAAITDTAPQNNTATIATTVLADTDGDHIPDTWETTNGLEPGNAADALFDLDGDGLTNLQEYFAGTDPRAAHSTLEIAAIAVSGNDILINFTTVAGKRYCLDWGPSPAGPFTNVLATQILGTGGAIQITDPNAAALPTRYYRVRLLP